MTVIIIYLLIIFFLLMVINVFCGKRWVEKIEVYNQMNILQHSSHIFLKSILIFPEDGNFILFFKSKVSAHATGKIV